jgi:hypothetical protein
MSHAAKAAPAAGSVLRKRKSDAARKRSSRPAESHGFTLKRFFNRNGTVKLERVASDFRMSKGQLAETVGLAPESLYKAARAKAPKTQTRMIEMLEIVNRVMAWAGGKEQAMAWYRAEPIPALGDRTAESLVKAGQAAVVRDYLDVVATGGFA